LHDGGRETFRPCDHGITDTCHRRLTGGIRADINRALTSAGDGSACHCGRFSPIAGNVREGAWEFREMLRDLPKTGTRRSTNGRTRDAAHGCANGPANRR
jgi:hypothetical protein